MDNFLITFLREFLKINNKITNIWKNRSHSFSRKWSRISSSTSDADSFFSRPFSREYSSHNEKRGRESDPTIPAKRSHSIADSGRSLLPRLTPGIHFTRASTISLTHCSTRLHVCCRAMLSASTRSMRRSLGVSRILLSRVSLRFNIKILVGPSSLSLLSLSLHPLVTLQPRSLHVWAAVARILPPPRSRLRRSWILIARCCETISSRPMYVRATFASSYALSLSAQHYI